MFKTRIRRDDTVEVIAGRDKGKQGRVLEVNRNRGRLLVEHVMMVKKHVRPNPQKQIKGGIAESESTIAISNVLLVCFSCGAVRTGTHVEDDGRRTRVCGKCGSPIDKK
jgi:large subunit ribosomal protein L24